MTYNQDRTLFLHMQPGPLLFEKRPQPCPQRVSRESRSGIGDSLGRRKVLSIRSNRSAIRISTECPAFDAF